MKTVAVILSGCGHRDGSEIQETVLTLWALHRNGLDFECFAPNIPQHHVLNHLTGEEMAEQRNVLVESARIARGKIRDIEEFDATSYAGIILPGGLGVVKNLSDYRLSGLDFQVNKGVRRAVLSMAEQGKPIGALCISPVIIAKLLGDVKLTLGPSGSAAANAEKMGATHVVTGSGEVTIDRRHKIVTTPCYMLDAARVDQIGDGADGLVKAMVELME
ncbi:MAG: isoprenoid biosynthesis glyoxalase ElbB [Desulfobulbaceae bacterium]|nr:isoprenoid biosynthesis glyoxalase ElbB [Desulfobulbaceae bacterium]